MGGRKREKGWGGGLRRAVVMYGVVLYSVSGVGGGGVGGVSARL